MSLLVHRIKPCICAHRQALWAVTFPGLLGAAERGERGEGRDSAPKLRWWWKVKMGIG